MVVNFFFKKARKFKFNLSRQDCSFRFVGVSLRNLSSELDVVVGEAKLQKTKVIQANLLLVIEVAILVPVVELYHLEEVLLAEVVDSVVSQEFNDLGG